MFVLIGCSKKKTTYEIVHSSEDSLSSYFALANDDNLTFQKKQEYNKKAFAIVMNQENDSMHRVNLFKIANRYFNMNDWNSYGKTVRLIIDKSKTVQDTANIAKAYSYFGEYYGGKLMLDSAYIYYFKAEKLFLKLNDSYNLARTRLNKANLLFGQNDFLGSEMAVFNALRVIKDKNFKDIEYESYNLLGIIYNDLEEYNKALEYLNKALESIDNNVIPLWNQSKATTLNNIGFVYQNMDNHKKAINFFNLGLKQKSIFKDKVNLYATLLDNLAYSKFKTNNYNDLPNLFYKSLRLKDSLGLQTGKILSQIHLSEYYAYKKTL